MDWFLSLAGEASKKNFLAHARVTEELNYSVTRARIRKFFSFAPPWWQIGKD